MEFVKMHGLGNDFIITRATSWYEAGSLQPYASNLCDRYYGIGADGLAAFGLGEDSGLFMRIFNPDGSEAEMCGNAIRCVAYYAWQNDLCKTNPISVKTLAGIKYPEIIFDGEQNLLVRVDMGEPILEPNRIPVLGTDIKTTICAGSEFFNITAVSMGNPHCIIITEDISKIDITKWGPVLENHSCFPARTNVEFVQAGKPDNLSLIVWERGAGITLACGTGACGALVAAVLNGVSERRATVHLPGGDLLVEWKESDNRVYMTGPATQVYRGSIDLNLTWGGDRI
jgi:diaminopimelate epimerase